MGAWNWRTNGLLRLRLIRRWIAVCNSLGRAACAIGAGVGTGVGVGVGPCCGMGVTCG